MSYDVTVSQLLYQKENVSLSKAHTVSQRKAEHLCKPVSWICD